MNFDKYLTAVSYPKKDEFSTVHAYKGTKYLGTWKSADFREQKYCDLAEFKASFPGAIFEVATDMAAYQQAANDFNNSVKNAEISFKADLIAEFGMTDHPKANQAFAYAWKLGKDFEDVAKHFKQLVDLIK